MDIQAFWQAVLQQDEEKIRRFFHADAYVRWHNTNEHFNVDEFIRANCEYPGKWAGEIQQIEKTDDRIITATHVYSADGALSFHVVSFITIKGHKIAAIDEYWGDDGPAPQWRRDKQIGTTIQ